MSEEKVLLVDDHPVFRDGIKHVLNDMLNIFLIDEADSGSEAFEKISQNDYDLLILDITMPGNNGLDILKEIRRRKPELPVLVLSMHSEQEYGLRVIRAGGSGYLTKASKAKELVGAVERVLNGGKYITNTLAEELAYDLESSTKQTPVNILLSDREYQVLRLIMKGSTISEIAEQLFLSSSTVYSYRINIFRKTRTRNNMELIRYATQNKLVDMDDLDTIN